MFGPKINTVFKSRWNALFWSAGILLTAYCSVPAPEEGGQAGESAKTTLASKGGAAQEHPWWAKDPD